MSTNSPLKILATSLAGTGAKLSLKTNGCAVASSPNPLVLRLCSRSGSNFSFSPSSSATGGGGGGGAALPMSHQQPAALALPLLLGPA